MNPIKAYLLNALRPQVPLMIEYAPRLDCPECLHPLILADACDADGWYWTINAPVTCPCGCVARVAYHDDGDAYAEIVTPSPVEP